MSAYVYNDVGVVHQSQSSACPGPHHTSPKHIHRHTWTLMQRPRLEWNCMVIRRRGWIDRLHCLKGLYRTRGWGGGDGGRHGAQIDVRLLKMKIVARDKRECGSRHGEENGVSGDALICLGDGRSQGREMGWINGGGVKKGWKWRCLNKWEHILLGGSGTRDSIDFYSTPVISQTS